MKVQKPNIQLIDNAMMVEIPTRKLTFRMMDSLKDEAVKLIIDNALSLDDLLKFPFVITWNDSDLKRFTLEDAPEDMTIEGVRCHNNWMDEIDSLKKSFANFVMHFNYGLNFGVVLPRLVELLPTLTPEKIRDAQRLTEELGGYGDNFNYRFISILKFAEKMADDGIHPAFG